MRNKLVAILSLLTLSLFCSCLSFAQTSQSVQRDSLETCNQRMLSNRKVLDAYYQNSSVFGVLKKPQYEKVLANLSFSGGYVQDGALVSVRCKDVLYYGENAIPAGGIMKGRGYFHGDRYFVDITFININEEVRDIHFQLFDYWDKKKGILFVQSTGKKGTLSSIKLDISISSFLKAGTEIKLDRNNNPIIRVKDTEFPCWIMADYSDGFPDSWNRIISSF